MEVVDTKNKDLSEDDAIIAQALDRFRNISSREASNRKEAIGDLNMLAGRNHWPPDVVKAREDEGRPVLTINKLPSFVDQVINDSRLNKTSIKVLPNGGGSSEELAITLNGLVRNIENVSNAGIAYQTALEGATNNGFGYFRIVTEYSDDTSFDQDIVIKRIKNPMTVYLDPQHDEYDGRDIRFAFVTEMISKEEYKAKHPGRATPTAFSSGEDSSLWCDEDRVRVAEYWVKEPDKKRIYLLSDGRTVDGDKWDGVVEQLKSEERMIHLEPNPQDPQGQPIEVEGPSPEGTDWPQTVLNPTPTIVRKREVKTHKVVQYIIDGQKVMDKKDWPGKFIPIIPVWGKELVIDEERILRGLIRFAKDPQKMYNYFRTAATETVALAPRAPYLVEEGQIEGHEESWNQMNSSNHPYLKYKSVAGVAPPQRQIVAQTAIGEITEANVASDEIKATTSLFNASMGEQSNEVSGRAIFARQREGDVANFTFHDNLKRAIKYAGDILVDLIPYIYDTERQIVIIGDDETESTVTVNQVVRGADGESVTINDLSLGNYKVVVSTGPSFTTQRVESAQSMLDFIRVSPESANMMIDLIAENMDWPGAVKIANRFRKLLPPGIDDEGPMQPQEPSLDDTIKGLKAEGITLGNEKKKLDIVEKRGDITNHTEEAARAGAKGALMHVGILPEEEE